MSADDPNTLLRILFPDRAPSKRGGPRPGSGRKPRGGGAARARVTVWLAEEEAGEITAALRDDETISQLLRDGGLRLVRARKG